MRILHLPTFWTVLLDILAWLMIHLGVAFTAVRIRSSAFDPAAWPFRPRAWEDGGGFYVRYCGIKWWKSYLPDGAALFGERGFPKRHLASTDAAYLRAFARETCRAELTHWVILSFSPWFFLWNKPAVGVLMVAYGILENLPVILAQRYNRARLLRVLKSHGEPSP